MKDFFPRIQDQKKGLHQKWNTFFPNSSADLRSDANQSQIIGGDADVDHTQIIGGYIPPSPAGFGTPAWSACLNRHSILVTA